MYCKAIFHLWLVGPGLISVVYCRVTLQFCVLLGQSSVVYCEAKLSNVLWGHT